MMGRSRWNPVHGAIDTFWKNPQQDGGRRVVVRRSDDTLLVTEDATDEVFSGMSFSWPLIEDEASMTRDNTDWPRAMFGLSEGLVTSVVTGPQGAELGLVTRDGGVSLVADLWPGPWSSNPEDFFVRNGRLFFTAQSSVTERFDALQNRPGSALQNRPTHVGDRDRRQV